MIAPVPARARQLAAAAAEALRRAIYGDEGDREPADPFLHTSEWHATAFGAQAVAVCLVLFCPGRAELAGLFLVAGLFASTRCALWLQRSERFNNAVCAELMRLSRPGALRREADAYDAEREEVTVSRA